MRMVENKIRQKKINKIIYLKTKIIIIFIYVVLFIIFIYYMFFCINFIFF